MLKLCLKLILNTDVTYMNSINQLNIYIFFLEIHDLKEAQSKLNQKSTDSILSFHMDKLGV